MADRLPAAGPEAGVPIDLLVVGGGLAGLTAAIYSPRAGIRTVVVERMLAGGQAAVVETIENYPGFPDGVSGIELAQRLEQQARKFGSEIIYGNVESMTCAGRDHLVRTSTGQFTATAVIIASGVHPSRLGVAGEEELAGRGVSYCATCDGPLYRGKRVAVIGGGNAAVGEALYLARLASQVTIVHRRDELRAFRGLQERALADPKIAFAWSSVVDEIVGPEQVTGVRTRQVDTGEVTLHECDAVFIYAGIAANTQFLGPEFKLDERGFVVTDQDLQSSVEGVYAAGDVRSGAYRQLVCAAAEGALAARSAYHYITTR
jgi:thioredoxin reductase (NADPH)